MMTTIWLLYNNIDYESDIVHSVYAEKLNVETLTRLIVDQFGYAYTEDAARVRAEELYQNNGTRFLSNYTWELEERIVV